MPPMVFQWFLILLPSLSMVFDGSGPLVKRCDGFDGSLWSTTEHFTNTIATKQKEEVLNRKRRLSKVHTKFKQKSIFCADCAKLIQNIFVAFFRTSVVF